MTPTHPLFTPFPHEDQRAHHAAIAVAIIGYALWKVFFAGKKEGYDTKEDIDADFDKKYQF